MVRATPANFGIKTDGVIALDITAIGHLLDVTGPIKTDFYGTITGKNIADKLLVKGYSSSNDPLSVNARHDVNDALMATMLSRLTEGGGLIGKMQALGQAVPGRHLQMYFRDDALQKVMVDKGMAGTIPVAENGNLTAVYTQNGNGNKLDVYQRRTVRETGAAARGRVRDRDAHGGAGEPDAAVYGAVPGPAAGLRHPLRDQPRSST